MTLYVAFFLPETKDLGVENVMIAWDTCALFLHSSALKLCYACPVAFESLLALLPCAALLPAKCCLRREYVSSVSDKKS